MGGPKPKVKSFEIDKRLIVEAWEKVRANSGAPGVDAVSIKEFQSELRDNLYKLWNRMASGSYFPGPVRAVEIPKDHGLGVRLLGVPNTADRVAQTAAAMLLESIIGERFDAIITGASDKGTWARLSYPPVEGRLVNGNKGMDVGQRLMVKLISTNVERGFIDFEKNT